MMYVTQNRENQALVLALLRSQQLLLRAMIPVFRAEGLTVPQWDVLEVLNTKGAITITDLLGLTHAGKGTTISTLNGLQKSCPNPRKTDNYD